MDYFTSNEIVFRLPWLSINVRRCLPGEAELLIWWWSEMPIKDGIRAGMGGLEHELLPFVGETFREVEDSARFRIDQFDLPVPVLSASRFHRW